MRGHWITLTVKAPAATARGYDAGKKINGRKRHIAVDTHGRLLMVNLTTADVSDSAGARQILDAIRKRWPWIKHLFANGAYDRTTLMDKAAFKDFVTEIVRRTDSGPGFKVLPRRWVVERRLRMDDTLGGASCAITKRETTSPRRLIHVAMGASSCEGSLTEHVFSNGILLLMQSRQRELHISRTERPVATRAPGAFPNPIRSQEATTACSAATSNYTGSWVRIASMIL